MQDFLQGLQGARLEKKPGVYKVHGCKVCKVTRLARLLGLNACGKACKDDDLLQSLLTIYMKPTTENENYKLLKNLSRYVYIVFIVRVIKLL